MKTQTQKEKQKNETPAQKFVRVVDPKTVKTIALIRQISKCIGKNYYDVEQSQVTKIELGLQEELKALQESFDSRSKTSKKEKETIQGLL